MRQEPLFIRVANNQVSSIDVLDSFISSTTHEPSKNIALKVKETPPDLSIFVKDFSNLLQDIVDNGVNQQAINYINSYMKPSLEEVVESSGNNRISERRYVYIKAEDTPWIEAMICYNLCLYIKAYGYRELKRCYTCKKFFSNKGKHAVYCSDACKMSRKR